MQQIQISEIVENAWHTRYSNTPEALRMIDEAILAAESSSDNALYAEALSYSMLFRFWFNEQANYLENLLHSLDLLESSDNPLAKSRINNIVAIVYDSYGDYPKALFYCQESLKQAVENNLDTEQADTLITTGQIYLRISDFKQATEAFLKALELRKISQDLKAISSAMNLLGRTYTLEMKFQQAEEVYLETLKLRQEAKDETGLPWTYLGLATVAMDQNKMEEAQKYFQTGLLQNEKNRDKRYELLAKKGLAEINYKTGITALAKQLFEESLELATALKMKSIMAEIHHLLSLLYESEKEFALSHQHLKAYIQLKEEVINHETANKLRNQQIAFSVAESRKEAEIHQLRNVVLKKAYDAIEFKNKQIIDSITYAKRIQSAILPPNELFKKYFSQSFILYLPKDIVSGDFYWILEKNGKIFFTNADCTGHGVPGAFVSIIGKIGLDRSINEFNCDSPSAILKKLNELLTETFVQSGSSVRDGMDMALCAYNPQNKTLEFAGARNPLYLIRNNEVIIYKADRQSIENAGIVAAFTNHVIELEKNDRIYLFSDGVVDQFGGPENKKFMQKRLQCILLEMQNLSMEEQKTSLINQFIEWKGTHEQTDDVSLLGIEILE